MNDEIFLLWRKCAALEIRSQVINPTETTAFTTSLKTSIPSNVTPAPLSLSYHVPQKLFIFLRWPQPLPKLALNNIVVIATVVVVVVVHNSVFCHDQIRFPHLFQFQNYIWNWNLWGWPSFLLLSGLGCDRDLLYMRKLYS